MEFDYETAWEEVAKPNYESLSNKIKDLVNYVSLYGEKLVQQKNLDMPWPINNTIAISDCKDKLSTEELKSKFINTEPLQLAQAARTVYNYGHWASSKIQLQSSGAYWKFSNYCDQILREKFDIINNQADPDFYKSTKEPILTLSINEGVVRVQLSTAHSWYFTEVLFATEKNISTLRELISNSSPILEQRWETFVSLCKLIDNNYTSNYIDTSKYIVKSGTIKERQQKQREQRADSEVNFIDLVNALGSINKILSEKDTEHFAYLISIRLGISKELIKRAFNKATNSMMDL